jgi:hypothetical protein
MTLISRQFGMASEVDVGCCASKENPEEGCSTSKRLSNAHFNLPRIMKCAVSYNVKAVETSDRRLCSCYCCCCYYYYYYYYYHHHHHHNYYHHNYYYYFSLLFSLFNLEYWVSLIGHNQQTGTGSLCR